MKRVVTHGNEAYNGVVQTGTPHAEDAADACPARSDALEATLHGLRRVSSRQAYSSGALQRRTR